MATAAWMQKACRAGILVRLPTRKARDSQMAAVVMLGPTYLNPRATLFSIWGSLCLSMALLMMNMLSTPMARMRKGITSPLIMVKPIPRKLMRPIELSTDASTMRMPVMASVKPEEILEGNYPMATPTYNNMAV